MKNYICLFLVCLLGCSQAVYAQQDTGAFNIRIFGGSDTEAPTAPVLTSATAIATDQVDLVWAASTDNFMISGYVVYRDGSPVSTTTLTSYSDVGLAASTTYTYTIRAFDPSYNYSSSSNALAATTLDTPPPPSSDESATQSTAARIVLNNLYIESGLSTSTFFIETARPARFEIRWGRTATYELGYIVNDTFVSSYETTLTGLEPGTTYEYEVVGYTPFGKEFILEQGRFVTQALFEKVLPPNISRFSAIRNGTNVDLKWQTPKDIPHQYVRVVRNHFGFPTHVGDGAVVYQGKGESAVDENILSQFSPVYYTAFVVDEYGNVSSGAVAIVYAPGIDPTSSDPQSAPVGTETPPLSVEAPAVASTSPALPAGTRMPDVSEILLAQKGEVVTFATPSIRLAMEEPFILSIPTDALFENIKTIIVTITDPTDSRSSYSFLLKLNKDKTAYEASIASLQVEGVSRITIDIYDYKAAVVGTYTKSVLFTSTASLVKTPIFPDLILMLLVPVVVISFMLFLILLVYRHKTRSSQK